MRNCLDCEFSEKVQFDAEGENAEADDLQCRRFPPRSAPHGEQITVFVKAADWCGEYSYGSGEVNFRTEHPQCLYGVHKWDSDFRQCVRCGVSKSK